MLFTDNMKASFQETVQTHVKIKTSLKNESTCKHFVSILNTQIFTQKTANTGFMVVLNCFSDQKVNFRQRLLKIFTILRGYIEIVRQLYCSLLSSFMIILVKVRGSHITSILHSHQVLCRLFNTYFLVSITEHF